MVDKFYTATKVSKMGFALFAVLMHYSDVFTYETNGKMIMNYDIYEKTLNSV